MKILYVITKLELGGAQKVCLDLAEGFAAENDVWLMSGPGGMLDPRAAEMLGDRFIVNPFMTRSISPLKDLLALRFLRKFIRAHAIDLVHTHSSKAGILGRRAAYLEKVPRVFHTVHGFPFNEFRHPLTNYLYKTLEKRALKHTRRLITVTSEDTEYGLRNGIGTPGDYVTIRAAADIDGFSGYVADEAAVRDAIGAGEKDKIVVQVSCFKPQKDPVRFVQLARTVKRGYTGGRVLFLLIGDGVLRKEVEAEILALNMEDDIRLLGWQNDIRPYLAVADVFTLTSLWEGLPIAVVEAFAMKVPAVVTSVTSVTSDGATFSMVRQTFSICGLVAMMPFIGSLACACCRRRFSSSSSWSR